MRSEIKIAKSKRVKSLGDHIINRYYVTERLTHFRAINHQMPVMDPIANKFFSGCSLTLGNFIRVMDGHVFRAAGVDIDRIAKVLHRHRRTLDMPARKPIAERTLPMHLVIREPTDALKPKHEIRGMLLLLPGIDICADRHILILKFLSEQTPVSGKLRHVKITASGVSYAIPFANNFSMSATVRICSVALQITVAGGLSLSIES